MSDTDGSTPIEQIESASGSTETHPAAPPAARSQKTVIAALVVFIAFLIVFGVYWVQTTEARFERQVTDALRVMADMQERIVFPAEPEIVELNNGSFAKVRYETFPSLIHMARTQSSSYPFEATITTPYDRFATISHATREAAQADNQYFRLPDEQFFSSPQTAAQAQRQYFYQTSKLEVSVLWDAKLSKWLENSRGSPPPDGSDEAFAPGNAD